MNDDASAVRIAIDAYRYHTFSAGESEGLLYEDGRGLIFAIRGTEFNGSAILFGDALIDGLAYPWKHEPLGWGHKGFMVGRFVPDLNRAGAIGLFWKAAGALLALREPPIITGHSKGGAEALFVGALLAHHGRPPKAIVTFGCPRPCIGDTIAGLLRGVPLRHHVIDGDPVPKVPAMPWWRRPGKIVWHPRVHALPWRNHRGSEYKAVITGGPAERPVITAP